MSSVDLSEFMKLSKPRKRACQIETARTSLSDTEREQFDAALAAGKEAITASAIIAWLKARDLRASVSGVTSHRHQTCACADD